MMACSVIIPTHGAAPFLAEVVAAVVRQSLPPSEILVVDNNWSPQVAARMPELTAKCRVVYEPTVGLSAARNTGARAASSPFIAFLDDDTLPDPGWLEALRVGADRYASAVAGGSVHLRMPGEWPSWIGDAHRQLLAELVYDGQDIPSIPEDQYVCGGNMISRRGNFERFGWFSEQFGRDGRTLRSSEELEWCRRMQAQGERISFIAAARVTHQIAPARLSSAFFLRRAYWQGRSNALLEKVHGRPERFGARSPAKNIVCLARRAVETLLARTQGGRAAAALEVAREAGFLVESGMASSRPVRRHG